MKRMKQVVIILLMGLLSIQAKSQVVISESSSATPASSSMLDVQSTTKGILIPTMTQAQRDAISNPATGLLIFQTDNTPGFYYNAGTPASKDWKIINSGTETDPVVKAINGIVKSNGSTISAAQAADFPILNQNTTGTAANVTGIVEIFNGGTGSSEGTNLLPDFSYATEGDYLQFVGGIPIWTSAPAGGITDITGTLPINVTGTSTKNISLSGTINPSNGGTGISTYTIGDLLYASATNTLAKLNSVAEGNVLLSGGVGTAPSYGKVGLTTHISGTLPISNGGTGSSTYTSNQLLYYNGSSIISTGSGLTWNGSSLSINASMERKVTTTNSNITLDATHNVVLIDNSGGAVTITLPAASSCPNRIYSLKKITNNSTNTITISSNGGSIDNGANLGFSNAYRAVELISDGSNWWAIGAR